MALSNDRMTALVGNRFGYDSSIPKVQVCDSRGIRPTIMFCSKLSPDEGPHMVYSPFAAASPRDEVLLTYERFVADRNTPPDVIWALHALHPWCETIRNWIARRRLRASGLPLDLREDVTQTVKLAIWGLILESPDAHAWCLEAGVCFCGWTYKLNDNFCGAAVRSMRRETLGIKTCRRVSPDDDHWQAVLQRDLSSITAFEQRIDLGDKLSAFPERTQQILEMRGLGFTLAEAAQELGITRDAARWAVDSWLEELKKAFAPTR